MSRRIWYTIAGVVLFFLALHFLFLNYPPERIVALVGVENTYLTIFLIAAVGGVNVFTNGVLYGSLLTFAAGGANPYWLGISCGVGIAIGDALLYWLFRFGTKDLSSAWGARLATVRERIKSAPLWLQSLGIYGWLAFTPLPNDILMFVAATVRFRFAVLVPLLLAGGITFATLAALFGQQIQAWL